MGLPFNTYLAELTTDRLRHLILDLVCVNSLCMLRRSNTWSSGRGIRRKCDIDDETAALSGRCGDSSAMRGCHSSCDRESKPDAVARAILAATKRVEEFVDCFGIYFRTGVFDGQRNFLGRNVLRAAC